MVLTPDQPFPKTRGHVIRSKDWNDAITEVQRLDTAKVNKAGDAMTGPLTITGNVGIGTTNTQHARLTIEDAAFPLSLRETGQAPTAGGLWRMPLDGGILRFDVNTAAAADFNTRNTPLAMTAAGNVGIGTATPNDRLDVAGNLRALTGSNPIRFTAGWSGFPDTATNQAEIANDTGTFKSLMIAGNRSAGLASPGGGRKVSVFDILNIHGILRMNTELDILFRSEPDLNHGIGWYGPYPGGYGKAFAGSLLDGPVVYGFSGGALGSTSGGQRIALFWNNSGNVGIGRAASTSDRLDVQGNVMLRGTLRFPNATTPMMHIFESGDQNLERPIIAHSPPFPTWGLSYRDTTDTMIFQGGGTPVMAVGLSARAVNISGSLTKSSGSFLIDHPLDPENKTLRHNFVESPENLCLYRGKVKLDGNGRKTFQMPDYFAALTQEDEATVYLTSVGREPFPASYQWDDTHTELTIFGTPRAEVSYVVLADRDDPTIRLLSWPVEEEKDDSEKGRLIVPEAFGQPAEMGVVAQPLRKRAIPTEPLIPESLQAEPMSSKPVAPEMSGEVEPEGADQRGDRSGEDVDGVEATEAAERKARELGVQLSDVEGTGSGGRILVEDVEKAAKG